MTPGALDLGTGIYVAKLNPAGSALIYGASFGGSQTEYPMIVKIDSGGNVYIAGQTSSGDFPTTGGAVAGSSGGTAPVPYADFVAKLSADGSTLLFSTLGAAGEEPEALGVDSAGDPELVYWNAGGKIGVRRYNAGASSVLFDSNSGISARITPFGSIAMTVDSGGNATLFLPTTSIAPPLLHPTQTCSFPAISSGYYLGNAENGFMIRLDPARQCAAIDVLAVRRSTM